MALQYRTPLLNRRRPVFIYLKWHEMGVIKIKIHKYHPL